LDLGVTIKGEGLAIGLRRNISQDSHLSLEIGRPNTAAPSLSRVSVKFALSLNGPP
jgi:hypothetical protein